MPKVYVCRSKSIGVSTRGTERHPSYVGPCKCDPHFGNQICNSIAPKTIQSHCIQFFKIFILTRRARGHIVKRLALGLSTKLFPGFLLLNYSGASPAQLRLQVDTLCSLAVLRPRVRHLNWGTENFCACTLARQWNRQKHLRLESPFSVISMN
jgi:hypothetical protein